MAEANSKALSIAPSKTGTNVLAKAGIPVVFLPLKYCASLTRLASNASWGAKVKATVIDKPTS